MKSVSRFKSTKAFGRAIKKTIVNVFAKKRPVRKLRPVVSAKRGRSRA